MNTFPNDNDGPRDNTTHQWSEKSSYKDYTQYQIALMIWKTLPPCIFLFGCFGNIATIFVMRRSKDHNSSQHAILMSLAVSDLTMLCIAIPRSWILYVFEVDIVNLHAAICKLRNFLVYVSGTTSAWLVTCVTVQRTMAVLWPHRMRVMCTVRRTWIVIATLVLCLCVFDFHLLIGLEVTESGRCDAPEGLYQQFYYYYFSWIDMATASFLPSVCLLVCDVILSVSLFKAVASSSSMAAHVESDANAAHSTDSRKKSSYRTTVMVLAISCAFLVLTLPICVRIVWNSYNRAFILANPKTQATDALVDAVTYQLWSTNSAINFVLYCLTGTKFRREFLRWIRCGAQSPSAPSVYQTNSEASREGRHQHHGNNPLSK